MLLSHIFKCFIDETRGVQMLKIKQKVVDTYIFLLGRCLLSLYLLINTLPLGRLSTTLGLELIWDQKTRCKTSKGSLYFHSPNSLCHFRAKTLFTKEPETILWIEGMDENAIFFDIGANIGLYSVYAAHWNVRTYAFEPSPFNIEILFRNVNSNELSELCTVFPISLSSKTKLDKFFMSRSDMKWGGAHNSVMYNLGYDGNSLVNPLETKAISFSLDEAIRIFQIPYPTHLKIDVDGLEMEILRGAKETLQEIKSILIEVSPLYSEQFLEIEEFLIDNNFQLVSQTSDNPRTSNQIWNSK